MYEYRVQWCRKSKNECSEREKSRSARLATPKARSASLPDSSGGPDVAAPEVQLGIDVGSPSTTPDNGGISDTGTASSDLTDADDAGLRPRTLAEFVGQAQLTEHLEIVLEAARRRAQPADHLLFAGPPGLGKTSLAGIVAAEMGVGLRVTSGPVLVRAGDLAALTEPMAVGLHAVNRGEVGKGQVAIVIGCGPVGLSVIAALKIKGVGPIVTADYSPKRRALANSTGSRVAISGR